MRIWGNPTRNSFTVPPKEYLFRQAVTLLKFAKAIGDPSAAAALLDKAADLNEKIEDPSLPKMDLSARPPDVQTER